MPQKEVKYFLDYDQSSAWLTSLHRPENGFSHGQDTRLGIPLGLFVREFGIWNAPIVK